jgi:PAS domain S-box-containing protein
MPVRSRAAGWVLPAADLRRRLRRWWLNQPVRVKGLLVIAVPLIVLFGTTSASLVLQYQESQQRSVAVNASTLTGAARQVLADAVSAESGVRGYAATGNPAFLQPYHLTLTRIGAERTALRVAAVAEGDVRGQRQVDATTGQILRELAQLRAAASVGFTTAGLPVVLLAGKTTMDQLRAQVAALIAHPAAMALPRRAAITSLERSIDIVDIAGLVLGLLAGLGGVILFTSGISRRLAVAAANADRLGRAETLEQADPTDDELGQLARSIAGAEEFLTRRAALQYKPRVALLAAIIDSSADAIVSKNVDGLITSWNPGAERIYGYLADEIVGQNTSLLLEEGLPSEEAEIRSSFIKSHGSRDNQGSMQHETVQRRKDGTTFPVSLTLSAIYGEDGTLIGTSSIGRDITEERHAAVELRHRMADLERANQNLETFTYTVSHDLRAPLRSLSGFSAALLEDYRDVLGADGRDYAERIDAAAGRMALLIEDLLQMSRLWRTEIRNIEPVDLSAEVTVIAGDLQRSAPARTVRFAIQDGVCAPADPVLIRTVLENLVGNAWKFTSRQDDVLIEFGTVADADAPICCYVRDNGAGFDPAYAGKLFQPFQRLHTAQEFPGTGIGLASVQQIIERHGGRIWAEGVAGQGATFYFTLDAKKAT